MGAALFCVASAIGALVGAVNRAKAIRFLESNGLTKAQAKDVISAFDAVPKVKTLAADTTVYRTWGGSSSEIGPWVSPNNYGSATQSMLALPVGNTAVNVSTFVLPAGTQVLAGTVAPLGVQLGGGIQWWLQLWLLF